MLSSDSELYDTLESDGKSVILKFGSFFFGFLFSYIAFVYVEWHDVFCC